MDYNDYEQAYYMDKFAPKVEETLEKINDSRIIQENKLELIFYAVLEWVEKNFTVKDIEEQFSKILNHYETRRKMFGKVKRIKTKEKIHKCTKCGGDSPGTEFFKTGCSACENIHDFFERNLNSWRIENDKEKISKIS